MTAPIDSRLNEILIDAPRFYVCKSVLYISSIRYSINGQLLIM